MKQYIAFIGIIFLITFFAVGIWGVEELDNKPINLPNTYIFSDRNQVPITYIANSYGWFTPYTGAIDNRFTTSLLEIEDARFFSHLGIDIPSKISALWDNATQGSIVRGGSTITEQYIKNTYFIGKPRTYLQKGKEAILGLIHSIQVDKKTTLRSYLDSVYLGNRIYGVDTAIQTYFGKDDLSELDDEEIVTLLALIKYPGVKTLEDPSWLTYREQVRKRLGINENASSGNTKFKSPQRINRFPLLTNRLIQEIGKKGAGEKNSLGTFLEDTNSSSTQRGNTYVLSLDGDLQAYAENSLKSLLAPLAKNNVTNGAVYIYSPNKEKVLAYVGNRSEGGDGSDVDMIQRRRSVGSILKPFLYLEALKAGAEIDTLLMDGEKIYATDSIEKKFIPMNYNLRAYGPVLLREALGNSLNLASVRLTEALGIDQVYRKLKNYGLDLDHEVSYYGYGLILGGAELTLENVVQSFSLITDTNDRDTFLLSKILESPNNRSRSFGISSILNTSIPLAVKTGTSTDFKDNWTIGYNEDAVIGVWVGNLDSSSMIEVSGITGAAPIWHDVVEYMIRRGLIRERKEIIPIGINETYECLDANCYRKEKTYKKNDKGNESRILEKLFYRSDFFTPPTDDEMKKWKIIDK